MINLMAEFRTFLTIAGSDPVGGAGLQADLKTAQYFGLYGMSVVTCVTAQNSQGLQGISVVSDKLLDTQIESVLAERVPDTIKIGLLCDSMQVAAVGASLRKLKEIRPDITVIADPVLSFTAGGFCPGEPEMLHRSICQNLLPVTDIITPNLTELKILAAACGCEDKDVELQARSLLSGGCRFIVATGSGSSPDRIFSSEGTLSFESRPVDTSNHHGTGCLFSSAIACIIALHSGREENSESNPLSLEETGAAVKEAKQFVTDSLIKYKDIEFGMGYGPANMFLK